MNSPTIILDLLGNNNNNNNNKKTTNVLAHKKKVPYGFPICVLQMHMPRFLSESFAWSCLKVSTTCVQSAKALVRLRLCAGSPEPLVVAYAISILFSCADIYVLTCSFSKFSTSTSRKSTLGGSLMSVYKENESRGLIKVCLVKIFGYFFLISL